MKVRETYWIYWGFLFTKKNKGMIYKFEDNYLDDDCMEVKLDYKSKDLLITCFTEKNEASITLSKQDVRDLIEALKTIEPKMPYE
jgi:hypothetical protein